jgi:hypothetical protein
MEFQQLSLSRPTTHQHEDSMLTPVDTVHLTLLNGHLLSIE